MQVLMTAETCSGQDVVLPFHYQAPLQAVIYQLNRDSAFGGFLHDVGYQGEGRVFRLFAFSQILQRPKRILKEQHRFVFPSKISWVVSSVENPLVESLLQTLFQKQEAFQLAGNTMQFCALKILPTCEENPVVVRALSPVCVYSTVTMPTGKRRTIYYHPKEAEFSEGLKRNLQRKYLAYNEKEPENKALTIQVQSRVREVVTMYKNFVLKGWIGEWELSGSPELIQMAFCGGLGGKNAAGFGLVLPKSQLLEVM